MKFGVDYYPEHWPKERWELDAKMMKEAHFDVVRLAEFAWGKFEPTEGQYEFEWLDRAIEIMANHDIDVVLGTPTAAPPPWLTTKHPEILVVNEEKQVMGQGHRRHACINSEVYRDYSREIVSQLANRYGNDERIIAWQTDNELGHPVCYCERCREGFHNWLKEKYGDIESLNEKWGTVFWSHVYNDWKEIPLPNENPRKGPNPSLHLDYKRFFSDSVVDYNELQVDVLRENTRDQPITHNFMGFFDNFDHFTASRDLDFASWDHYPTWLNETYEEVSAGHDLTYGFKKEPFWVMEEQCSYLTRDKLTPQPRPGEIRMWTYQSIAHGANGIIYFRWRPCPFGDEQFHGGVLQHDGTGDNLAYQEVQRTGKELTMLEDRIETTIVNSEVGILNPYQQRWSMDTYRYDSPYDYQEELMKYYSSLFDLNVNTTFITTTEDFEPFKLIIAPFLPMTDQKLVTDVTEFVENGGAFMSGFRTSIKNFDNVMKTKILPGDLTELFGIEIRDFSPLQEDQEITITGKELPHEELPCKHWIDLIKPQGAAVLSDYNRGWPAAEDYAAITANDYGAGKAIYVGCSSNGELYPAVVRYAIKETGVSQNPKSDNGVEVSSRMNPHTDREIIFAVNHTRTGKTLFLPETHKDLLTDQDFQGDTSLEPFGVKILVKT